MEKLNQNEFNFLPTHFNISVNKYLNSENFNNAEIEELFKDITKDFVKKLYTKYDVKFSKNILDTLFIDGYVETEDNRCEIVIDSHLTMFNNLYKKYSVLFTLIHECSHINQYLYTSKPFQTQRDSCFAFMVLEDCAENVGVRLTNNFKLSEIDAQFNASETLKELVKDNVITNNLTLNALLLNECFFTLAGIWGMRWYDLEDCDLELESNISAIEKAYYKFYVELKTEDSENKVYFTKNNFKQVFERIKFMEQTMIETVKNSYEFIVNNLKENPEIMRKLYPFSTRKKKENILTMLENKLSIKNVYKLTLLIADRFSKIKQNSNSQLTELSSEE